MNKSTLWSLRLGYSGAQASSIESMGITRFLEQSFASSIDFSVPDFLESSPKSLKELQQIKKMLTDGGDSKAIKSLRNKEIQTAMDMKAWWVDKMVGEIFPLREKMTGFWQNHFVCTYQKVKVNYWIYEFNMILRENAFGNFKDLTKKILMSNAMVRYLDNTDNRKGKYNENLSRELLELFTLGNGNYTETDIKNGAKGLAGLGIGLNGAQYRKPFENNESFDYLGKSGNFKANAMVDIIFEHKEIPYLITRKLLKWFIYDNPSEELVRYYGDYFKSKNFEIKPLLIKIFKEEYEKENSGSKIKDPLTYIIQLVHELQIVKKEGRFIAFFASQQGMDMFNQPNVKGWDGGTTWLTSQIYLQRNKASDLFCSGRNFNMPLFHNRDNSNLFIKINLDWNKKGNNLEIIKGLQDRLLFAVDADLQKDFETILKHDFNPQAKGAENAVIQLFNAMTKSPEFQLI